MDVSTDAGIDGRWMTYAELAEARGIDKPSALKLALRRKWTRRKDNHGTMQVCVPPEWMTPPTERRDIGTDGGVDLSAAIATLQAAVTLLGDQLAHERTRADAADTDRRIAEARADAAEGRADRAEQAADRAHAEAQEATQTADELRQADAERKGRGRLARLRAAWRGE